VSHCECLAREDGEVEGREYGNKGQGDMETAQKGRGVHAAAMLAANKSQTAAPDVNDGI